MVAEVTRIETSSAVKLEEEVSWVIWEMFKNSESFTEGGWWWCSSWLLFVTLWLVMLLIVESVDLSRSVPSPNYESEREKP